MAKYIKGEAVANATAYTLHNKNNNYEQLAEQTENVTEGINFNLDELALPAGEHTLVVKASASGYEDSDYSNEVVYAVAEAGYEVGQDLITADTVFTTTKYVAVGGTIAGGALDTDMCTAIPIKNAKKVLWKGKTRANAIAVGVALNVDVSNPVTSTPQAYESSAILQVYGFSSNSEAQRELEIPEGAKTLILNTSGDTALHCIVQEIK